MRTTNTIIAFDMKDPAQVAALAKALEPTPAERASLRFRNACALTDEFAAKHLTVEQRFAVTMMDRRTVPAGVTGQVAAELSKLLAAEDAARVALKNGGEAPAYAMAAE